MDRETAIETIRDFGRRIAGLGLLADVTVATSLYEALHPAPAEPEPAPADPADA